MELFSILKGERIDLNHRKELFISKVLTFIDSLVSIVSLTFIYSSLALNYSRYTAKKRLKNLKRN